MDNKEFWIEVRRALVILARALKKRYDFVGLELILALDKDKK